MKFFPRISLVLLCVLLLAGCASTQQAAYRAAPVRQEKMVTDATYVAIVENVAKQRGTRVIWVNTPKKRIAREVAVSP